jgi:hypothetical protein
LLRLRVATKVGFHNFAKYEISQNTVGTMELAHAMELARSLSNDILGKLYNEFRPDFFTGVSLAY